MMRSRSETLGTQKRHDEIDAKGDSDEKAEERF
jgi:hypothetical protein